ncbi:MAG: DUF4286 family protein [Bacteroidales bacterium]|jgi:ABC-type proline/glycine betaine transport system substrate-binding protein|nr:DUF4286 family protein [Bacteroidales bacterium]
MDNIVSTTFFIVESVADKWVDWMKSNCISDLEDRFGTVLLNKVIGGEQNGGVSFSLLVMLNSKDAQDEFVNYFEDTYTPAINKMFPEMVYPFRVFLERV